MKKDNDIIPAILTVPVVLRMDLAKMGDILRVFGKSKKRL